MKEINGVEFSAPDDKFEKYCFSAKFNKNIHTDDNMTVNATELIYFWMGKTGLESIQAALDFAENRPNIKVILDMPSGWGRVMRFLRHEWPDSKIYACDIVDSAVEFCVKEFDALPIRSTEDVGSVCMPEKFDLIWVGSLLTHFDEKSAKELLRVLSLSLAEGGLLVFSIAGEYVYDLTMNGDLKGLAEKDLPDIKKSFEDEGFAHASYCYDVFKSENYGRSFIGKKWLDLHVAKENNLRPIVYIHRGYARRQDVVAYQRPRDNRS